LYFGGTLGYSGLEHHQVCGEGLVEIGELVMAAVTDDPVFDVFAQPSFYKNTEDIRRGLEIARPTINKAAADFNTEILYWSCKSIDMWNSTLPLPTVDSFKGVTMRAWNPTLGDLIAALGATPVVIPYAEKYTALATGVVQANACAPMGLIETKDYEVAKYYNLWPLQPCIYVPFVNLDAFNGLPKDLQDIVTEAAQETEAGLWKAYLEGHDKAMAEANKVATVIEPTSEELDKERKIAEENIWKPWREKAGSEANALMDNIIKALGY